MARNRIYYVGLVASILLVGLVNGYTLDDVQTLKQKLFTNSSYDKSMRPIFNQSTAIEVSVEISSLMLLYCSMLTLTHLSPFCGTLANCIAPGVTPQNAASHLGLFCLHREI